MIPKEIKAVSDREINNVKMGLLIDLEINILLRYFIINLVFKRKYTSKIT